MNTYQMPTSTELDKFELIDTLMEAQEKMFEAIDMCEHVAKETNDNHAMAYLVDHLKIRASDGHGFMTRDFNLSEWIEQIRRGE